MRCICAALLFALGASPALAQRAPEIVIPGRPDVPVLINGVDVSYAVIEGDFGLDRPGEMSPTVIYGARPLLLLPYYNFGYGEPGYFPRTGKRPGYGRLEVVPRHRHIPPPAPTYFRYWSSDSAAGATDSDVVGPSAAPPIGPPLLNSAPMGRSGNETYEPFNRGQSEPNGPSGQAINPGPDGQFFRPNPRHAFSPWAGNGWRRAGGRGGRH